MLNEQAPDLPPNDRQLIALFKHRLAQLRQTLDRLHGIQKRLSVRYPEFAVNIELPEPFIAHEFLLSVKKWEHRVPPAPKRKRRSR